MLAGVRRASTSRENVRWLCRSANPQATSEELELLVDATIRAGYPDQPLTLAEACEVLRQPPPPGSVRYLHSRSD
jgi:hypothetical protein